MADNVITGAADASGLSKTGTGLPLLMAARKGVTPDGHSTLSPPTGAASDSTGLAARAFVGLPPPPETAITPPVAATASRPTAATAPQTRVRRPWRSCEREGGSSAGIGQRDYLGFR